MGLKFWMAQFLNQLLKIFCASPNKRRLRPTVDDNETIARFIFSSGHFAKETKRIKYGAYLPAKNGEASVYRVTNLHWDDIWKIGKKYVETDQRKIRACAETTANEITRHSLNILPETKRHYRHANIIAWPQEKHEIKMLAIEIANNSSLYVIQPSN
jgi:hypothetical protein